MKPYFFFVGKRKMCDVIDYSSPLKLFTYKNGKKSGFYLRVPDSLHQSSKISKTYYKTLVQYSPISVVSAGIIYEKALWETRAHWRRFKDLLELSLGQYAMDGGEQQRFK